MSSTLPLNNSRIASLLWVNCKSVLQRKSALLTFTVDKVSSTPWLRVRPTLRNTLEKPLVAGNSSRNNKSLVLAWYTSIEPYTRPAQREKSKPMLAVAVDSHFKSALPKVLGR